jgi:hypothetical protein
MANGRTVIIIRVPQSWNPPNGIPENGHYLFFKRHAAGRDPMTLTELRSSFTMAIDAVERMRAFHRDRLEWLRQPRTPNYQTPSALVLHLIPFSGAMGTSHIDLNRNPFFRFMSPYKKDQGYIQPGTLRYNLDGPLMLPIGGNNWHTQLFRNGSLEYASTMYFDGVGSQACVNAWHLQTSLVNIVPRFIRLLESLGAMPPLGLLVSLINVENLKLRVSEGPDGREMSEHQIDRSDLRLPEAVISESTEDPKGLLKPVFDAVWNAAGLESCRYYRGGEWNFHPSWLDDPD